MGCLDVFKMPVPVTIMGRTSSITNSFVNGIIPCIMPTEEQVRNNLRILGMDETTIRCAYCGDRCTEWDHFRPLVENKRPTGYISEIDNLVPVCGKCNQSKGNKTWREWITGGAPLSPKTRGIGDLEQTIERLKRYEEETHPVGILVQTEFKGLLESEALSAAEIDNLQDAAYSNRTFGINFPVLKKVESMAKLSEERKDHLGRDRYYAKPVKIRNEWYLLSTQWYERNRERLVLYLEYHGGGFKITKS